MARLHAYLLADWETLTGEPADGRHGAYLDRILGQLAQSAPAQQHACRETGRAAEAVARRILDVLC